MDTLIAFARAHPSLAVVLAVALAVGGYLLLNRKPRVVRQAEQRERELKEQSRERYRTGRSLG
ncbi:MAG TPA: hypothetical protein VMW17_05630 [Candidatus Binatia bacterium]|nr:hypothetical protein [Candidatus Binatia bacterium]